jgi:hypothetical protein
MRLRCVRQGTLSEVRDCWRIKQMHNRSESGRGARVALCAHPTRTDTDSGADVKIESMTVYLSV